MKVLWFSNTPANSDEYFNNELKGTGGWLKSLDKELQNKVELHIAFYHNKDIKSFKYLNTFYHPIYKKAKSKIAQLISLKFSKIIFTEDVDKYLSVVDKVKPDIIHIHGTENPFGYIIDKTNIPIVISIQGNITVCYHKYLSGIEKKYFSVYNNFTYSLLRYSFF